MTLLPQSWDCQASNKQTCTQIKIKTAQFFIKGFLKWSEIDKILHYKCLNENKKTISKATSYIKDNMKLRMIKILLYKCLYKKQKTISKGTYFIKSGNDPFTSEWGLPSIQQTNMYTNENQKTNLLKASLNKVHWWRRSRK